MSKVLISVFLIKSMKTPLVIMVFTNLDTPKTFTKWNCIPGGKVTGYLGIPHLKPLFPTVKKHDLASAGHMPHDALGFSSRKASDFSLVGKCDDLLPLDQIFHKHSDQLSKTHV